jgi:hypothetical protein
VVETLSATAVNKAAGRFGPPDAVALSLDESLTGSLGSGL